MNNPKNLKLDINSFKSVGSEGDSRISDIKKFSSSDEIEDDRGDEIFNFPNNELKKLLNERATSLGLGPETHFNSAPELRISTPNRRQAEISDNYYSSNYNPRHDRLTAGPRVEHNRKLDKFIEEMQGLNITKKLPSHERQRRQRLRLQRQRQRIEDEIDLKKHIESARKESGGRGKIKRKYKTKKNKRKYRKKL